MRSADAREAKNRGKKRTKIARAPQQFFAFIWKRVCKSFHELRIWVQKSLKTKKNPKLAKPDASAPPSGPIAGKDNAARGRQKKPLHWAKAPMNLLSGSVWPALEEAEVRLGEEETDELFGVHAAERFPLSMQQEVKQEMLPRKRKCNINILLANLKMSSDAIKGVARAPTFKSLEPQTLSALLLICPDLEEEQLLQKSLELKGKADGGDAFMMELSDLKGLRGKILCALSVKTFNEEAVDAIRSMDACAMIPVEAMNSEKLKKASQAILALGSFLSSGAGRGGACGFKLEALAMLSAAKGARGGALLDYLMRMLERDAPGLLPLDDMPTLPRSAEMPLEAIGEGVANLLPSVANATEKISQIGEGQTLAAFKAEMEALAGEAAKARDEIASLRGLMMQKLELMMGRFGERSKKPRARQEDLCACCASSRAMWKLQCNALKRSANDSKRRLLALLSKSQQRMEALEACRRRHCLCRCGELMLRRSHRQPLVGPYLGCFFQTQPKPRWAL